MLNFICQGGLAYLPANSKHYRDAHRFNSSIDSLLAGETHDIVNGAAVAAVDHLGSAGQIIYILP